MTPEPEEIDEDDYDSLDYESPYPIDDRHLVDSVYSCVADIHTHISTMDSKLTEIHKSYRHAVTLSKILVTILIGWLVGLFLQSLMELL